jgi:glycerophosphoryl diester phosphodiesterase
MSGPIESQRRSESDRVIVFAHRGAPAPGVPPNSIAAFAAALHTGANAIEADIQLTTNGVPVLAHRAVKPGKPIRRILRADLDDNCPALADLWERCGVDFDLALDMGDPRAAPAVVALARRYGALERL